MHLAAVDAHLAGIAGMDAGDDLRQGALPAPFSPATP